ncbi:MAG: hypothetical protein LAO55_20540 [Acidobacteriia bacterium]|nr:hypothetical protein [Terriglobia bacterium]
MREPLIPPLIAFAAGILLDQAAPFSAREAVLAAAAFAILAILPAAPWIKKNGGPASRASRGSICQRLAPARSGA